MDALPYAGNKMNLANIEVKYGISANGMEIHYFFEYGNICDRTLVFLYENAIALTLVSLLGPNNLPLYLNFRK